MSRYYAFIDESGDHSLNTEKEGASKYFIVLAILVRSEDLSALENGIENLRHKYFGDSEIKSNKTKDLRREKIFNDLAEIDFKFYAVAVNKEAVIKDSGLSYHKSFIKYTNDLLYSALFKNYPDITIFADGHGDNSFIDSFKKYIETRHIPDLFSESKLEVVNSKEKVLVQLADLIVGTLAKIYDNKLTNEYRIKFTNFIKDKRIRVDEWPPRFEILPKINIEASVFDNVVCNTSFKAASDFLKNNIDSDDEEVRMQFAVVGFLLFKIQFSNDDFSTAQEMITHLKRQGFFEMNKQAFRSKIISKLRDKDVIIAATSKGLKIPTSYADIVGFAHLVDGIVFPLLSRLHRANEILKLSSAGDLNFLEESGFSKLQKILNDFDNLNGIN